MYQKFNPDNWLQDDNRSTIERIVKSIESSHTDITGTYADWRNIGFALADELAEGGRDYFHRISRFYHKYSYTDCNKQYDQCLKSQGHGITIKTLFHLAKMAGIEIGRMENGEGRPENGKGRPETGEGKRETREGKTGNDLPSASSDLPSADSGLPSADSVLPDLPTLPDAIYDTLPDLLKKVVNIFPTREVRDIMLLGSMATLSACLPNIYGIYDNKRVFANLFLFVTAQASAGKGNLVLCKRLVYPVHWQLKRESQALKAAYDLEMREYNLLKQKDFNIEKPIKPPEKMLFIPANNSTTGVFQILSDSEGKGLMFETEGDTLSQAFKSDYGNYSDGFRKAFHHESISYYRRTDREYVEIDYPSLSTVLSSTPRQVASLIPNAENGLFSRFIFYHMNMKAVWMDVLEESIDDGLGEYMDALGQEFLPLYKALLVSSSIKFKVTDQQHQQFNAFFTQLQDKYLMLQGMEYMATIRRLGLIAFRMAMVFSALRLLETGDFSPKMYCSDDDFQAALSMVRILVRHASHVYSELPVDAKPAANKNKKEQFLDKLPERFTRTDYVGLAKSLSIPDKTADRYISTFCEKGLIFREQHGTYINLSITDGKKENSG